MKIILTSYKDKKQHSFEVEGKTLVKDLIKKLEKEIGEYATNIQLLFSSQMLEEQNNLDFYNIKDNDTIFYLYKKIKKTKSKNNNNINKKQEINTNTIFQENKPIEIGNDIDNDNLNIKLKIYSSIIKIMTYKNKYDVETILEKLKKENKDDYNEIMNDKAIKKFKELLQEDITEEDTRNYRNNYNIVLSLKKEDKYDDENNKNKKIKILLNEDEDKFITYWMFKGLKRETIIFEYFKNKLDVKKTEDELKLLININKNS